MTQLCGCDLDATVPIVCHLHRTGPIPLHVGDTSGSAVEALSLALRARIADLERRLAESEASCAAMREALATVKRLAQNSDALDGGMTNEGMLLAICTTTSAALSSAAGADLLREVVKLRELEKLMPRVCGHLKANGCDDVERCVREALSTISESRKPR